MINQQLLDYIRQQSTNGVAKEEIFRALVAQGWKEEEVREGFAKVENQAALPPVGGQNTTSVVSVQNTGVDSKPEQAKKSMWGHSIPRSNRVAMKVSLALVFIIDLIILFLSGFSLFMFWAIMLAVLGIFAIFFFLENHVFSKRFGDTKSALDKWIAIIIALRNLVFILNFIPLIQVFGLGLLGGFVALFSSAFGNVGGFLELGLGGFGGIGMIIPGLFVLYIILIVFRFTTTKQDQLTTDYAS